MPDYSAGQAMAIPPPSYANRAVHPNDGAPTQLGTIKARLNEMCLQMNALNQATDVLADRIVGSYPRPAGTENQKLAAAPNGAIEEVGEMVDRLEGLIRNHDNILGRFKSIA